MKNYSVLLMISLVLLLLGCNQEDKKATADIQGKWLLDGASRAGTPTKTLSGVYIHFLDDKKLESNLPYNKTVKGKFTFDYIIDNQAVKCLEAPDFNMKIKSLEANKLVLLDTLYNFPFEFTFKKEEK